MNAAALTRIRIVSGTTEDLIQSIYNSIRQERNQYHMESAIYRSINNLQEILVLSLWSSLDRVPELEEAYRPKSLISKELTIRTEIISRQVYQMVKDYRVVSAIPGASHIRLLTFHTSNPEKRLRQSIKTIGQFRQEAGPGNLGYWLGRLVEDKPDNNTLRLLVRQDWRSLEEQLASQQSNLMKSVEAYNRLEGAEVEIATQDLAGVVRFEQV